MASPQRGTSRLPQRPDLRQLRQQAADLLRAGEARSHAEALLLVARGYGFPSWPKLKQHVDSTTLVGRLADAIDSDDLPRVMELVDAHPDLLRAPIGYGGSGPLTRVAQCRTCSETRLEMARWLIARGADVHQNGDAALMRAALADHRVPMIDLLVAHGADPRARFKGTYPVCHASCEVFAPAALRRMLEHGADPRAVSGYGCDALGLLVGTYMRAAASRRHACFAVLSESGLSLPDEPVMDLHAGRLGRLTERLKRDATLRDRRFARTEIYPSTLVLDQEGGYTATPVDGATLLHLALEFCDTTAAALLLDHGADANARTASAGNDGHTPLFHVVVSIGRQQAGDAAPLLVERGADPRLRATVRKRLRDMSDPAKEGLREHLMVTPVEYAAAYAEPDWVDPATVELLRKHGG